MFFWAPKTRVKTGEDNRNITLNFLIGPVSDEKAISCIRLWFTAYTDL